MTGTKSLYDIGQELLALNALLDEADGDLSRAGEAEAALVAWVDQLEQDQGEKLDRYIGLIRTNQMEATAAKAEEEQWAAKRKARESRAKYLETKLLRHLEATGQTKVTTASGRVVSVQKNGGVQPVEIKPGVAPADVPAEFHKVTVTIDNAAVRAALADGRELDFAELLPRGTHLKVK